MNFKLVLTRTLLISSHYTQHKDIQNNETKLSNKKLDTKQCDTEMQPRYAELSYAECRGFDANLGKGSNFIKRLFI